MSQTLSKPVNLQSQAVRPVPFVSVIIPVFNDSDRLDLCLTALDRQTYPRDRYEVIVVDNGSQDEPALAEVAARHPVRLSRETKPGSYCARNHGLSLATGEIVAFTDADCIPTQDWLEQGVKCLQSLPNCGLVAGRIELFYRDPQHLTPVELYESICAFPQQVYVARGLGGVTANLFTTKAVIERVGRFNETIKSTGDLEWGQRVASMRYKQVYGEQVCVRHPARALWQEIACLSRRTSGGVYDRFMGKAASPLEMHLTFGRLVYDNLRQIPEEILAVWGKRTLVSWPAKMKVTAVIVYVKAIALAEKFRLRWGGYSSRS